MKLLQRTLSEVYPHHEVEELMAEIDELLRQYENRIDQRPFELNEEDVLMITYADQLTGEHMKPLQSLHQFLDRELKGLINWVHLLPFYPYSSDDGFSVIDYYSVNPAVGNWENVKSLSTNYQLMFDAVINHISQESDWVKGYLGGDPAFDDYFVDADLSQNYSQVTRPRTSPLLHPFEAHDGTIRNLWTTFSKDQVDLDYQNPKVFLRILDVLLFYLSQGARMLRLDAIGFMWKEGGTSCIHLPQTHALIQAMRIVLEKACPNVILITETNVPHSENVSYFGDGHNEARMVYNFTLPPLLAFSLLKQNAAKLTSWAQRLKLPSDEVCFFNFTASHDGIGLRPVQGILDQYEIEVLTRSVEANNGFISYRTAEGGTQSPYELNCKYYDLLKGSDGDGLGISRFIMSQAVMLTMPGLPAFYFHSLVGSENDLNAVEETKRYRSINREKLNKDQLSLELRDENNVRHHIFKSLTRLIAIKKSEPAFHPFGGFSFPDHGFQFFSILRISRDQTRKVLAIYNMTDETIFKEVPEARLDLLTGKPPTAKYAPLGYKWLLV